MSRNYYEWEKYERTIDGRPCYAVGYTGSNINTIKSFPLFPDKCRLELLPDNRGVRIDCGDGGDPLILSHTDWLVWDGEEMQIWSPGEFSRSFVSLADVWNPMHQNGGSLRYDPYFVYAME